ncbi:MAG: hypothetical protein U1G07_09055 [Verrucomicrobiota bacterium]
MNENRFTHLIGSVKAAANSVFVTPSPESEVVDHIEELIVQGQTHLQHEEFTLALQAFSEAQELILHTVHPDMPIDFPQPDSFRFPVDATLIEPLAAKTAEFLNRLPPTQYSLPVGLVSAQSTLSTQTQAALQKASAEGWRVTSFQSQVGIAVSAALDAAERKDWASAIKQYEAALNAVPENERVVRGSLLHDLAIVTEQSGDRSRAQELGQSSIQTLEGATEAQAQAVATTAGIFGRSGNAEQATRWGKVLDQLLATHNFNPVVSTPSTSSRSAAVLARNSGRVASSARLTRVAAAAPTFGFDRNAPTLMGLAFVETSALRKVLTLEGTQEAASISLDGNGSEAVKSFLATLAKTKDVGLLTQWLGGPRFVAHLPRIYSYLVPMAIGDCHAGLGNLEEAFKSYQSALEYPPINQALEVTKAWTRMAQTILDQGDRAYRLAGDDTEAYPAATAFYQSIVRLDKTIDPASPLYSHPQLEEIKGRVEAFLAESDPLVSTENPAITTLLLQALSRLGQIAGGVNFFGFGPDYVPPFSFEYLQNTSRYFAEHASQTEQRYIQHARPRRKMRSSAANNWINRPKLPGSRLSWKNGSGGSGPRHRGRRGQRQLRRCPDAERGRDSQRFPGCSAGIARIGWSGSVGQCVQRRP